MPDSLENTTDQLAFLKAKRTPEPQVAPPDESLEDTVDEVIDEQIDEKIDEESDNTEQPDVEEEELDGVYLIDDEEVTLDQIREWKRGNLRESDYTRKTQDLAEQRKLYEAKESKITNKAEKLDTLISDLEQSIDDQESKIDWEELAEDDPSQYLKLKAKIEVKQKNLDKAKAEKEKASNAQRELYLQEQRALIPKLLPEWSDSSGATDKMKDDLKLIGDYLGKNGFSDQEMNEIVDAKLWPVYLDAARFRALNDKTPEISKRVKAAPKVIKPTKARTKATDTSVADEASARLRKSGNDQDGLAYLKSRRTG